MKNTIKGGKADKMSIEDIANKFNISVEKVKAQIKKGVKVEKEHTNDKDKATEIAMDHLTEFPDYYDRLEKMETTGKKAFKTESTKTLIKQLLRENLEPQFTEDFFKSRVPFFKEYKIFKHPRYQERIQAQRVIYHTNVKKIIKTKVRSFLTEENKFLDNIDYEYYMDNAKNNLRNIKKIEGVTKGVTRRGDKYIIIRYIPNLTSHEFDGGEHTRGLKIFYKDDEHLNKITQELNLPIYS
jgi:hypothetical protein